MMLAGNYKPINTAEIVPAIALPGLDVLEIAGGGSETLTSSLDPAREPRMASTSAIS